MSFTWDVNEEAKVSHLAPRLYSLIQMWHSKFTMNTFSSVCFGFMDILLALMVIMDDELAGVVV